MSSTRIKIIIIIAISIISFIIGAFAGTYYFNKKNPEANGEIKISPPIEIPIIKGPTAPPHMIGPKTPPPAE